MRVACDSHAVIDDVKYTTWINPSIMYPRDIDTFAISSSIVAWDFVHCDIKHLITYKKVLILLISFIFIRFLMERFLATSKLILASLYATSRDETPKLSVRQRRELLRQASGRSLVTHPHFYHTQPNMTSVN